MTFPRYRSILLGLFLASSAAHAQQYDFDTVELNFITSWDDNNATMEYLFLPLYNKLQEEFGDKVSFSRKGPESVPSFQQFKPLRAGVFDVLYTHPAYHSEVTLAGNTLDLAVGEQALQRTCGLTDLIREKYQQEDVHYIGRLPFGIGYRIMLKEPIDGPDLSGLKIRSSSFYDPMIKALGGSTVRIAPAEIYTSLDRGVVDGIAWADYKRPLDLSWQEAGLAYDVRPHFGEGGGVLIANLDTWNDLPQAFRDKFMEILWAWQAETRQIRSRVDGEAFTKLAANGMKVIEFDGADAEKWLNAFYENATRKYVLEPFDNGEEIAKAIQCVRDKDGSLPK